MWVAASALIQGTSHVKENKPCQDSLFYIIDNDSCCIALADGAGSCDYSEVGANISCQSICEIINREFDKIFAMDISELKLKIIHRIRTRLGMKAKTLDTKKSELSSTLLFFAIKENKYIMGHIGDGLIALLKDGNLRVLSFPENGEFINTTYFTTSKNYLTHLRIQRGEFSDIKAIFMMSDGAADCLYQRKEKRLAPALKTISEWIDTNDINDVNEALQHNMQELFTKHTSDDCSLIILQNKP